MADKLVVDTNVFVDAFLGEELHASNHLLSNLDALDAKLLFSQDTVGELLYILKRNCNESKMELEDIQTVLYAATSLFHYGKSINTNYYKKKLDRVLIKDESDQMFVDTAFAGKATHILTYDKKSGILDINDTSLTSCIPEVYLDKKYAST